MRQHATMSRQTGPAGIQHTEERQGSRKDLLRAALPTALGFGFCIRDSQFIVPSQALQTRNPRNPTALGLQLTSLIKFLTTD